MENTLSEIIQRIELYCEKNTIDHRFVGGVSYGGLLNKKTTYTIDVKKKKVFLKNHNNLILLRADGTICDIDIILFCNNSKKIADFKKNLSNFKKKYQSSPPIPFEATIYPLIGQRKKILQFVTILEVDKENNLFLTFDEIKQQVNWKSVEPWSVVLENKIQYTTRNPIADYYAYLFRSPSGMKPKDKEKLILLKKLVDQVLTEGRKNNTDYESDEYFGTWVKYIDKLEHIENLRIQLKKNFLKLYWQTVGTYFAHGKGIGKIFLPLLNQFTGIKQ